MASIRVSDNRIMLSEKNPVCAMYSMMMTQWFHMRCIDNYSHSKRYGTSDNARLQQLRTFCIRNSEFTNRPCSSIEEETCATRAQYAKSEMLSIYCGESCGELCNRSCSRYDQTKDNGHNFWSMSWWDGFIVWHLPSRMSILHQGHVGSSRR